jgi:hypothetical protein
MTVSFIVATVATVRISPPFLLLFESCSIVGKQSNEFCFSDDS